MIDSELEYPLAAAVPQKNKPRTFQNVAGVCQNIRKTLYETEFPKAAARWLPSAAALIADSHDCLVP